MTEARLVIVNADDFGLSRGVNRGIVEAHERGIVTSASLMVNRPAAREAAAYARGRPELGVGLHVDLRHWQVGRRPWSRIRSDERLRRVVGEALSEQLDRFRGLVGGDPTHLDSHQHRHREPPLRPLFESLARELGVPLRHFDPRVRFCGEFYGHDGKGRPDHGSITPDALAALLETLSDSATELGCHPGYTEGLRDWYRDERPIEVESLCNPSVRAAVERLRIELVSFSDLRERDATLDASSLQS